ncbi:MAG: hypothetical protein HXN98_02225 [Prevotella salivae]|nr:hypothetical protein [Segatella salivae]
MYGGLRRKSSTPTALFPTNHTPTQSSLHYRLATLGYRKYNTYIIEMDISNDYSIFFDQDKN